MKTLIVARDLMFTSGLRSALASRGVSTVGARTTLEVNAALADPEVKLVVVDLELRGGDPFEICDAIAGTNSALPIVGYYSHVREEIPARAVSHGVRHCVTRGEIAKDPLRTLGQFLSTAL